jgi:hypothetical protein
VGDVFWQRNADRMHFHRDFFLDREGGGLTPVRIKVRLPKV